MDYNQLASELLEIKIRMVQTQVESEISSVLRGELCVLDYLIRHQGKAHPKELSCAMDVSSARIARMLKHMEEKELIRRVPDSKDYRQINVFLTGKGTQIGKDRHREALHLLSGMLEQLGEEDAANYVRIQRRIAEYTDRMRQDGQPLR